MKMSNYKELSKCVQIEYDNLLKVNNSEQSAIEMDTSLQESTSLVPQSSNGKTSSVVIQIPTDKITELPVTVSSTNRIRFPIGITVISLLQIVLHLYDSNYREQAIYFSQSARILLFTSDDKLEVWRFLTYMFVHQDKFHLGVNIFFQLLGGVPLEISHGWWRVTIVYLAGVIGGSLGVEAISKCEALVGGSAGVYSILGAHFSTLVLNWKETEDRAIRIFILIVYVLTDFFNWMCIPQFGSSSCILVSELTNTTITHFSGFMIGILTAILILKNIHVRSWERKTQLVSLIVLLFIVSLAICLIVFLPDFNIKNLIKSFEFEKNFIRNNIKDALVKCKKLV